MMEIGEIRPVKEANAEGRARWEEACDKWDHEHEAMPYVGFYVWFTDEGFERTTGYVGRMAEHSFIWRKTKREVIAEMNAKR